MELQLPLSLLWMAGAGIFGAGGAWGVLAMRGNQAISRIETVEIAHKAADAALDDKIADIQYELHAHKAETTDRLARIETKMDVLLDIHTRSPASS